MNENIPIEKPLLPYLIENFEKLLQNFNNLIILSQLIKISFYSHKKIPTFPRIKISI
jgi:hypothetical protein